MNFSFFPPNALHKLTKKKNSRSIQPSDGYYGAHLLRGLYYKMHDMKNGVSKDYPIVKKGIELSHLVLRNLEKITRFQMESFPLTNKGFQK